MPEQMGLLDPRIEQYMKQQRQQQFWGTLSRMGQGILQASMGGADFGPALAQGLGGAGQPQGGGLLDMMKMQGLLEDRDYRAQQAESQQTQQAAQQQYGMGLDPSQQALYGADPGGYIKAAQAQAFQKSPARKTATDVGGYRRYLDTGERAFPGAEKPGDPQYGETKWDGRVGKWYQLNPKTGKREYTSPLTGMEITTPEGLTVRTGVRTGMQKKTTGDIEKKLVGAREGLARLRGIAAKYRPEFQEIPTRLGVAWTGLKSRFGKGRVDSQDRRLLTEFADYRRDAISNINLYIKDITGAQMSATETDRLRLATPDPGEGIFGGDDPITFESKLRSAIQDIEKAAVRYEYYLDKGITDPEEMSRQSPLNTMRTAVNEQTGERLVEIDGQWVPLK